MEKGLVIIMVLAFYYIKFLVLGYKFENKDTLTICFNTIYIKHCSLWSNLYPSISVVYLCRPRVPRPSVGRFPPPQICLCTWDLITGRARTSSRSSSTNWFKPLGPQGGFTSVNGTAFFFWLRLRKIFYSTRRQFRFPISLSMTGSRVEKCHIFFNVQSCSL